VAASGRGIFSSLTPPDSANTGGTEENKNRQKSASAYAVQQAFMCDIAFKDSESINEERTKSLQDD
jgi:hypothetical protein